MKSEILAWTLSRLRSEERSEEVKRIQPRKHPVGADDGWLAAGEAGAGSGSGGNSGGELEYRKILRESSDLVGTK